MSAATIAIDANIEPGKDEANFTDFYEARLVVARRTFLNPELARHIMLVTFEKWKKS